MRSPTAPRTRLPNGLARKPRAKTPNASNCCAARSEVPTADERDWLAFNPLDGYFFVAFTSGNSADSVRAVRMIVSMRETMWAWEEATLRCSPTSVARS